MIDFEYRRHGDIPLQKSSSRERHVRVIEKHMPFICCPLYGSLCHTHIPYHCIGFLLVLVYFFLQVIIYYLHQLV